MGNSFNSGMGIAGSVLKGVVGGGLDVFKNVMELNPVGALNSVMNNISDTVSRVKSYAAGGDGSGSDGILHLASSVGGIANSLAPMSDALSSLHPNAPDVVKGLASTAATFHDNLAKTGSVVAAAKAAGSTPITHELAKNISKTVAGKILPSLGLPSTGMIGNIIGMANPVLANANMISSVNNIAPHVNDMLHGTGQEAGAMKALAAQTQNDTGLMTQSGG